ncbi:unnamed protein product [Ranitomeya imitator]|uniref:MADF domain-containing protein n=1 Tax=Ranitomeya imitator TaxID=111125 RepID=A0ABN9MM15_9NEOB|nr:unnamed protein product [Ranitomeya imitator]
MSIGQRGSTADLLWQEPEEEEAHPPENRARVACEYSCRTGEKESNRGHPDGEEAAKDCPSRYEEDQDLLPLEYPDFLGVQVEALSCQLLNTELTAVKRWKVALRRKSTLEEPRPFQQLATAASAAEQLGTGGITSEAASELGWLDKALIVEFWRGLADDVKNALATREIPATLEELIAVSTRIDLRFNKQRVADWAVEAHDIWDRTQDAIQASKERMRVSADAHRRPAPTFAPGDLVWFSVRNIRLRVESTKFAPRYIVPFKVLDQVNPVVYHLAIPPHLGITDTFHVSLLKPVYMSRISESSAGTSGSSTDECEVNSILVYKVLVNSFLLEALRRKGCTAVPLVRHEMSTNEQDCVRALIEMYRSLPCLWKIKSKDYSNRYMKREAYEKLVAVYREFHPTETVDENIVRKKIQALRTVFKKEVNKVENSKKSGAGTEEVYVPRLWYYDLMAFTRDQEIPRPCQTVTSLCEPSPEDILPESPDEQVPLQQRETTEANNVQSPQSSSSPSVEEQTCPLRPSRKRKSTAATPVDLLAVANSILSKHVTTKLSPFASLVEERLNRLDDTQRSHAERIMFDFMNAAAAGKLCDTSTLSIDVRQPSAHFYWGHQQEPMHSTPVRRPGPHNSQFRTPPAPPSFGDLSQGPPMATHHYSEMDTYYQNL